jgi:hypothetical protein
MCEATFEAKDGQALANDLARVRRLGELYTAGIGAEMDVEGSPAHAAARALSDRAYSVLVEIGDDVMTGGVRSFADAARLAALVKYHSDVMDLPPADRGDAILQALVAGILALGETGGRP